MGPSDTAGLHSGRFAHTDTAIPAKGGIQNLPLDFGFPLRCVLPGTSFRREIATVAALLRNDKQAYSARFADLLPFASPLIRVIVEKVESTFPAR